MLRNFKFKIPSLAVVGLLISFSTVAIAQDDEFQDSPSDYGSEVGAVGAVDGRIETADNVSNLYSKFSSANEIQRQAIIDSLQGIVQQLQSMPTTPMASAPITSAPMATTMPRSYPPVSSVPYSNPVEYMPMQNFQAPIAAPVMESFSMAAPIPAPPVNNVVNNYFAPPAPMPQPQSYVEYGPVFTPPVVRVLVPVVVPVQQPQRRHGCRLFHH